MNLSEEDGALLKCMRESICVFLPTKLEVLSVKALFQVVVLKVKQKIIKKISKYSLIYELIFSTIVVSIRY